MSPPPPPQQALPENPWNVFGSIQIYYITQISLHTCGLAWARNAVAKPGFFALPPLPAVPANFKYVLYLQGSMSTMYCPITPCVLPLWSSMSDTHTHTFATIHSWPPLPPVLQELCACHLLYYNATCSLSIHGLKFLCTVWLCLYLAVLYSFRSLNER